MKRDGTGDFTIGIEEEYLLVDPATGDLADDPNETILTECAARCGDEIGLIVPEFLRAQVEVGTSVCHSIKEVREKLAILRGSVAEAARNNGLAAIASSTHPSAAVVVIVMVPFSLSPALPSPCICSGGPARSTTSSSSVATHRPTSGSSRTPRMPIS